MHLIYKLTFENRKNSNNFPYYYIGAKTNSAYGNGILYDRYNKEYWSSSINNKFWEALKDEIPKVEILFEYQDNKELFLKESEILTNLDARKNIEYFNLSNGNKDNTFCYSGIGTYKHHKFTDVVKRLKCDDPLVLNKTFVGVSKGLKSNAKKPCMKKENNPFYGKKHKQSTLDALKKKATKQWEANTEKEKIDKIEHMVSFVRGKNGSVNQKKMMSETSKGMCVMINPETDHRVRVKCNSDEFFRIKNEGYVTTYKNASKNFKKIICKKCGLSGKEKTKFETEHKKTCGYEIYLKTKEIVILLVNQKKSKKQQSLDILKQYPEFVGDPKFLEYIRRMRKGIANENN